MLHLDYTDLPSSLRERRGRREEGGPVAVSCAFTEAEQNAIVAKFYGRYCPERTDAAVPESYAEQTFALLGYETSGFSLACQRLQRKYGVSPVALWRRPALVEAQELAREKAQKQALVLEVEALSKAVHDAFDGAAPPSLAFATMTLLELESKKVQLERYVAATKARKARLEREKKEKQAQQDYRARLAAAGWEMHHDEQGTP